MNTEQTLTLTQQWYRQPGNREFQIARVKARAEQLRPVNGAYVYGIWSEAHGKYMYIGKTTTALRIRAANHKLQARMKRMSKLCKGLRAYDWENFRFDILNDNPDATTEEAMIAKYDTFNSGWNSTANGRGHNNK